MTYFLRTALIVALASTFACQNKDKATAEKSRIAAKDKDGAGKGKNKNKNKRKRGKRRPPPKGPIAHAVIQAKQVKSGGKNKRKNIPAAIHFSAQDWDKASEGLATIATDFKENDAWLEVLPVPVDKNKVHYLAIPRCAAPSPDVTCVPHVEPGKNNGWTFASCTCKETADDPAAGEVAAAKQAKDDKPGDDKVKAEGAEAGVPALTSTPTRPLACQPTFVDGQFSCSGDCGTDACTPSLTTDGRLGCPCSGATAAAEPG